MEDKTITMFGWTCPRCMKVHSPYSAQCDCTAPSYTTTSSTQIIGTFCNKCQNIVCRCKPEEEKFINVCPHCGGDTNYLNFKYHLYMHCTKDTIKTDIK